MCLALVRLTENNFFLWGKTLCFARKKDTFGSGKEVFDFINDTFGLGRVFVLDSINDICSVRQVLGSINDTFGLGKVFVLGRLTEGQVTQYYFRSDCTDVLHTGSFLSWHGRIECRHVISNV